MTETNDGPRKWGVWSKVAVGFVVLSIIAALGDSKPTSSTASSTTVEEPAGESASKESEADDAAESDAKASDGVEKLGWRGPKMYTRLVSQFVDVTLTDCDNTHKLWTCTFRNNGRVAIDRDEFRSTMYDGDGVKLGISRYDEFPQDRVEPGDAIKVQVNGYYDGSAGSLKRIKIRHITGAEWDPR